MPQNPAPEPRTPDRDPGLAVERTTLAWQRTGLSLMVGALIMGRLAFAEIGPAALPGAFLAALLGGWVTLESQWRHAQAAGTRRRDRPRGGRAGAFLAIAVIALVLTEMAAVITAAS